MNCSTGEGVDLLRVPSPYPTPGPRSAPGDGCGRTVSGGTGTHPACRTLVVPTPQCTHPTKSDPRCLFFRPQNSLWAFYFLLLWEHFPVVHSFKSFRGWATREDFLQEADSDRSGWKVGMRFKGRKAAGPSAARVHQSQPTPLTPRSCLT